MPQPWWVLSMRFVLEAAKENFLSETTRERRGNTMAADLEDVNNVN